MSSVGSSTMWDHSGVQIGIGPLYSNTTSPTRPSSIPPSRIEFANISRGTSSSYKSEDELKEALPTLQLSSIQSGNPTQSYFEDRKVSNIREEDINDVSSKSHCKDFAQECCSLSRRSVRSIRHTNTKTWIICGGVTAVIGIFIFVGFRIASTMKNG